MASFALIYLATARLSLQLIFEPEGIAAIWPPAGIFLSGLLLTRRDLRPWLAAALCFTDLIAELLAGTPLAVSLVYALASTGNAVLSCWLVLRFAGEPFAFRRIRDVVGWLALSIVLSNALTSLVAAAASLLLPGTRSFLSSWYWWATSDGVGNLLVTPFILGWAAWARTRSGVRRRRRVLEGVALITLLALLAFALFSQLAEHKLFALFLPYVTFPFLLWAALRFDLRGVATANLILAAFAISFAAAGRVPSFSFTPGVLDEVIVVQLLLVITAVPSLFLAAVMTERRRAHDALREAEELHRVTLMSVGDAVISTGVDGRVKLINPVAAALTGWRQEEAYGRRIGEVFHIVNEETGNPAPSPVELVLRGGQVVGLANHSVLVARDGTERPIADSGAPIRDAQGEVIGVVVVFRDQTQERAAQKALRESSELLSLFIQRSPIYTYIKEVAPGVSRVLRASENFRDMIGRPGSEIAGKTMEELFPPEFAAKITADDWAVVSRGEILRLDEHLNDRDYTTIKFPITLGGKHLLAGYTIDITERKRAEEALAHSRSQLLQSQKLEAVGRLAGGVAHDFNNILQALLSLATVLRLRVGTPELAKVVREIEAHIRRGAGLTQQLLLFTRRQMAERKRLDLGELIAAASVLLRRLIPENIRLIIDRAPLPLWVEGDAGQLQQVLMNLAVNAKDAMEAGGILTVRTYGAPGMAVLEMTDTGHGIDDETRSHLFEPFFTTKEAGKGTGLGLSVVHGIVEQHDGHIEVDSAPGKGSVFRIILPALPALPAPEAAVMEPSGETEAPRGHGEWVLLVEDEKGAREGLTELLEMLGYNVTGASRGEEALALPAEPAPDLLLTDLVLPGIDGAALAAGLRERWPRLQVVLMSGYTEDEAVRRRVDEGSVRFLQKPFDLAALARVVGAALAGTGPGDGDGAEP